MTTRTGRQLNLLNARTDIVRDISARTHNKEANRALAKQFGEAYFDGTRDQGYGGYVYDGRWIPVAERIVELFGLGPGDHVLDVGCAKGFLVNDLLQLVPGLHVYGLDISEYALARVPEACAGRVVRGTCQSLPFPAGAFDAVLAINTIHNLDAAGCRDALSEIERVSGGNAFVQVDAYRNDNELQTFQDWMLTCECCLKPQEWLDLFEVAGYTGYYFWTILRSDGRIDREG